MAKKASMEKQLKQCVPNININISPRLLWMEKKWIILWAKHELWMTQKYKRKVHCLPSLSSTENSINMCRLPSTCIQHKCMMYVCIMYCRYSLHGEYITYNVILFICRLLYVNWIGVQSFGWVRVPTTQQRNVWEKNWKTKCNENDS